MAMQRLGSQVLSSKVVTETTGGLRMLAVSFARDRGTDMRRPGGAGVLL
jgi:hypothetical protein